MPSRKTHWEQVYSSKRPEEVSWHQASPKLSLALIEATGLGQATRLLDVGGGASRLVDALLDRGYRQISVLDISAAALDHARTRLGERAGQVRWHEADATAFDLGHEVDIWHDRAVFHFLTDPADRAAYIGRVDRHLSPGGQAIIAAFAPDGPEQCSNLPVMRYNAEALTEILGTRFRLIETRAEQHLTPGGTRQPFLYHRVCRR
ncbi:MAG: class I SAM-dependent methyltransferase [Betaproteobacteria bacterium]|nr:class I SAM-dependent methyltransferase [Betaproteobacteria bacterium]